LWLTLIPGEINLPIVERGTTWYRRESSSQHQWWLAL